MRSFSKYAVWVLMLAITTPLWGKEKISLSLQQARDYALEHNRQMKAAGFAVTKSEMALREAIAAGLPQVNGNVDYSNALGAKISIRFNENLPPTEIDIKPTSNFYLNVNQLIFSGNYIVSVQLARLASQLSELNQERTRVEVLAGVTGAYYLALLTGETRNILSKNLQNLQNLYQKTRTMADVGLIEPLDADQLAVQVNALRATLSSAERQHELALNLLRLQLGLELETEIELTDSLTQLLEQALSLNLPPQSSFLNQQIDYRIMLQQEQMSLKMVDMQRASYLPTLGGFYRYTYKLLKPDFDMTPNNVIGLQLNIPIFSSGLRYYKTRQAMIDLKNIQNMRELLSEQLQLQEKQLIFNFNSALEQYQYQQQNVEVSRRVYQSLQNKYEQGLISGLELTAADNNYLRAESDFLQSMMQLLNARLELDKLYSNIE